MTEAQKQNELRIIQERRENKRIAKAKSKKRKRIIALAAAVSMTAMVITFVYEASAKEINITEINDFDGTYETKTVKTRASSVDELLEEAGIDVSEADRLNVPVDARVNHNDEIILTRGKKVTIRTNYGEKTVNVTKSDATDALVQAGYIPGEEDEISVEGDVIQLVEVGRDKDVTQEAVQFETEYIEDSDLPEGETRVLSEGKEGIKEITSEVTYRDGAEVSREVIGEEITVEPENRVIAKGTYKPAPMPKAGSRAAFGSTPVNESGQTINGMKYSRKITMSATAYSTAPSENGGYTVSAMGSPLGYGIVAVDPSVIPLGSKVYVTSPDGSWSYGVASAEDTGGAIKGNKIDLCYDAASGVSNFGRRSCVVYVLE